MRGESDQYGQDVTVMLWNVSGVESVKLLIDLEYSDIAGHAADSPLPGLSQARYYYSILAADCLVWPVKACQTLQQL